MAKVSKKDINLYALIAGPSKRTVKTGLIFGVIGIAALVLMGGAYTGLKIYANTRHDNVTELEEKTSDPVLVEKLNSVNELMNQIAVLRSSGDVYKSVRLQIIQSQAYRDDFTPDLIETLRSCEYMAASGEIVQLATIKGLSYDGSVLYISAESADSRRISDFVDRLKALDLFSEVSYNGYSLATETGYGYTVEAVFQSHEYELTSEPAEGEEQTGEGTSEEAEVN
ncbi:MAG: hypothetical protein ACI4JD_02645 [Ruminococcus sp.]